MISSVSLPPVRKILPTCLFLSGFCALAYQVSWARYLGIFLGATAPAYTIVLATFMGGLALGAWSFGRLADRTVKPLRMYARLELMVGALCFIFPLLMDFLGPLFLMLAGPVENPVTRNILRAFLAIAVLAGPSILMGGTLPAATRFYVRSLNTVGAGVGKLYFINAFGAVIGAVAAGFFLIPRLGLHGTFWIAAAINAAIGYWALVTSRRIDGASACPPSGWLEEMESDIDPPSDESPFPGWVATAALIATASTGAASMIYEVSWIRMLTLVLGGSTYAFTIMVAAFILGIAIGSAIIASIGKLSRGGLATFGFLEISVAFIVMGMVPVYNRLSYFYVKMAEGIPRVSESYPQFLFVGFALSLAVMIIPTIILGATFPLAARLAARSMATLGGGVGRAYAFNTAGTLAGTIIAAHFLFPRLGLHGTFAFAASLNFAAGILCLAGAAGLLLSGERSDTGSRPLRITGIAAILCALVCAFAVQLWKSPGFDHHVLARGMFRTMSSGFTDYDEFRAWLTSSTDILYYRDGAEDTVAVLDHRGHLTLQVNGKADASSEGDMPTQICLGHLPMLLHPNPERVIVVGLGSGATSAAVLAHPDVQLTTVELSPQVVEGASYFGPYTRNVLDNPRLDLAVEDAKAYLGLTKERFDIIISEPSNPWVAGNANLFTLEFFNLMKSRLKPGGFVAQWFHDYEMTDETVQTILNTFAAAFPYTRLFHCGAGRDYAIIGATAPPEYSIERIDNAISSLPVVADDLNTYLSIRSALGIFTRNVLDDHGLREIAQGGKIHRDRRPVLDFQAPRGVFLRSMSTLIVDSDQRWLEADEADLLITRITGGEPLEDDESFEEVTANTTSPFFNLRDNLMKQWIEKTGSAISIRTYALEMAENEWDKHALSAYLDLEETGTANIEDFFERWRFETRVIDTDDDDWWKNTNQAIEKMFILAGIADNADIWEKLAETCIDNGLPQKAADAWLNALHKTDESEKWSLVRRKTGLARAHRIAGNLDRAKELLDQVEKIRSDYWALYLERESLEKALSEQLP